MRGSESCTMSGTGFTVNQLKFLYTCTAVYFNIIQVDDEN